MKFRGAFLQEGISALQFFNLYSRLIKDARDKKLDPYPRKTMGNS